MQYICYNLRLIIREEILTYARTVSFVKRIV